MTDIASIIQAELDRLNHSVEPFANYGRHIAATLSRLTAPPPEEIAGLIEDLISQGQRLHDQCPEETLQWRVAAALRSLAQELERTKDDLGRVQSVYDFAKLSSEKDALAQEMERLRNQSALDRTISGASLERIRELESRVKCDSCGKPFDENGGICEPCHSESIGSHIKPLGNRISELEAEVQRLKTEHINAEMAHGALHAIHELLDDGGVPRGTFADDHVRNLVAMYNQRGLRIRELEGELATWKDISVTIEKARAAIQAKTIEECAMAVDAINWIGPEGVDALTTAVKTIRALTTEATEACQESEKLDQKSRPSV